MRRFHLAIALAALVMCVLAPAASAHNPHAGPVPATAAEKAAFKNKLMLLKKQQKLGLLPVKTPEPNFNKKKPTNIVHKARRLNVAMVDPSVSLVLENRTFLPLAVTANGTIYGTLMTTTRATEIFRSTDEGQTWTSAASFPSNWYIWTISVLRSGTLIAGVDNGGSIALLRSTDGLTWTQVLVLPSSSTIMYSVLTAHSVTDDGTYAYMGTYNTASGSTYTNYIYRSADDGQTWTVASSSTSHRHIHFAQVNPYTGKLYVGFGDSGGRDGLWVSTDRGVTLQPVCMDYACVSVDMAFDPSGYGVFPTDNPFQQNYVMKMDLGTGSYSPVGNMVYDGYSSFRDSSGSFWVPTTYENGVPLTDPNLHLYRWNSVNGTTDVLQRPIPSTPGNYRMVVLGAMPNGDLIIQMTAYGTIVIRPSGGSTPPPTTSAPVNTSLPAINGTPQGGSALNTTTGSWNGSPTPAFAYQWMRCNNVGAICLPITGATATSYTLVSTDVNSTIRVRVTATNSVGSASADSNATAVITALPTTSAPVNTSLPTVSGTATVGQTLTGTDGSWSGSPTPTTTRQWMHCDSGGASCSAIAGATLTSYTLVSSDAGFTIRLRVSGSNSVNSVTADSVATAVVTSGSGGTGGGSAPPPTTTTNLAPDPDFESSPSSSWFTNGNATFSWATDAFHGGSHSLKIASSNAGLTRWLSNNGAIQVKGSTSYTATAWFKTNSVNGQAKLAVNYWDGGGSYLGSTVESSSIGGTTDWTQLNVPFTSPSTARSARLEFRLYGTGTAWMDDVVFTDGSSSSTPPPPTTSAPVNTSLPTVSGTATVGQTLTGTDGSWSGSPTPTTTRQWMHCDSGGASCSAIAGATLTSYTLVSSDAGFTIKMHVTATNTAGNASADSSVTAVVVSPTTGGAGGGTGGGTTTPPPPIVNNLAPDYGFESDPSGSYVTNGTGSFSWATDAAHSGTHSLKMIASTGNLTRWMSVNTAIPATSGNAYTASVYVMTVSGSGSVALVYLKSDGSYTGVTCESPGTSGSWSIATVSCTAPAGTTSVRVELRNSWAPDNSWFDDLVVTSS